MTHPPKERPLRVGNVTAHRDGEWFELTDRGGWIWFHVNRRQLPALARLVAKMRAAETRRGDMRGSDADPAQKRCSQCGKLFTSRPCGPTHAAVQASRRGKVRR